MHETGKWTIPWVTKNWSWYHSQQLINWQVMWTNEYVNETSMKFPTYAVKYCIPLTHYNHHQGTNNFRRARHLTDEYIAINSHFLCREINYTSSKICGCLLVETFEGITSVSLSHQNLALLKVWKTDISVAFGYNAWFFLFMDYSYKIYKCIPDETKSNITQGLK